MQPHVIEFGCDSDATPRLLQIDKMPAGLLPANDKWVAIEARGRPLR